MIVLKRVMPLTCFRTFRTARYFGACQARRYTNPSWATVNPDTLGSADQCTLRNFVNGEWSSTAKYASVVDPLNGSPMIQVPDTQSDELQPFVDSLAKVPKSGLHNPLKNPERYLMLGEVSHRAGEMLSNPDIEDFFTKCIQRVAPKSDAQARGEVTVTAQFLKNFAGDSVRFMAEDFGVSGDHFGQHSRGFRWPYGPVAIVAPFNFPLEIAVLQMMGAVYMGNKPVIKSDSKVSLVLEQYLIMLHKCGLPLEDIDLIHCDGPVMGELIGRAPIRLTQFTGSSQVAELLAKQTGGKVKIEDAGFDWKILGPDVQSTDYVTWQCDQDAYAFHGQKCSAQSILFAHENWVKDGILDGIKNLAAQRNLKDLTNGPVMTWTTEKLLAHVEKTLEIPGAKVLFGGKALTNHSIPDCYGAIEPTAVFIPLKEMMKPGAFELATTEVFGPFQVVTEFDNSSLSSVLEACERMSHHLTAGVVSNDAKFLHEVLGSTINGTTYAGLRARTTGAPANHWFGPGGDPRGAGIGSREAIRMVWSHHREIIYDQLPVGSDWKRPKQS